MTTPLKLLGIALAVVLVATGFVAAGHGPNPAAADGEGTTPGDGPAADADHPLAGTSGPWMTGDERLERFQERVGLTDAQVEQIRAQVTARIQDGADRDAIRAQVRTMLQNYGVDAPVLGPMDGERHGDGPGAGNGTQAAVGHGPGVAHASGGHGPGGQGTGAHAGHGPAGDGPGPHGPADGRCLN